MARMTHFRNVLLISLTASLLNCASHPLPSSSSPVPTTSPAGQQEIGVSNETYDVVILWLDMGARSRRLGPVDGRGSRTFRIQDDAICIDQCRLRGLPVGSADVLLSPPIHLREGWIPVWRITTNPVTSTVEFRRVS